MKETRTRSIIKRAELGVRRSFISFLSKRSAEPTSIRPLPLSERPKILLLRQDRLGDAIITTPLLVALRDKYPNAELMMLLGENNKGIIPLLPVNCKTFIYKKKVLEDIIMLRTLRKMKIDVVIDLQDNASATSSIITAAVGAQYSVGIEKENSSSYNVVVPLLDKGTYHISRRIAELLRPLGINPDKLSLKPQLSVKQQNVVAGRVAVNISVGKPSCWIPPTIQAEICSLVSNDAAVNEILVFAHPKYIDEQQEVVQNSRSSKVKPAPVTASYSEFASLLSSCEMLLTPDTSVVHLGAALTIPMVAYYPKEIRALQYWTPVGTPYAMIIFENASELSPDDVLTKYHTVANRNNPILENVEEVSI